jgi:hypothetical protein
MPHVCTKCKRNNKTPLKMPNSMSIFNNALHVYIYIHVCVCVCVCVCVNDMHLKCHICVPNANETIKRL